MCRLQSLIHCDWHEQAKSLALRLVESLASHLYLDPELVFMQAVTLPRIGAVVQLQRGVWRQQAAWTQKLQKAQEKHEQHQK